eukprot:COSAG02_NODE_2963_length_7646_cov_10.941036_8_plen_97_part_00
MSTTGLDDDGVSPWLDAFFGNCSTISGCDSTKVEGIAFHDYAGNTSNLLRRAEGLSARYGPIIGQPAGARIWITVSTCLHTPHSLVWRIEIMCMRT